jgi:putative pre-16S rRNA nuclease
MANMLLRRNVRCFLLRSRHPGLLDSRLARQANTIEAVAGSRRILALDLGKRRIGLAISDELGITAQGLETLERTGRRNDIEMLRRVTIQREVSLILVGDPRHMSGEASRQGDYTREFARELEYKTGLPVKFWDERWTSREAERTLRGSGIRPGERKAAIDRLSAVILLQSYLDSAGARPHQEGI